MHGTINIKYVESDFAVNKYLHTVASCWILLIHFKCFLITRST